MQRRITGTAIIDTGYWIALLEPRDQHHAEAEERADLLLSLTYLVP